MGEESYFENYINMLTTDWPLEILKERDGLLQQLQNELAKKEALRQEIAEQEQSNQAIIDLREAEHRSLVEEVNQLKRKLQEIEDGNLCCMVVGDHCLVTLSCGHPKIRIGPESLNTYCHEYVFKESGPVRIFGCHVFAARQNESRDTNPRFTNVNNLPSV